jgi:hypothetical protein
MIRVCACFRIPARKTNRFGRCYGFQKKKKNKKCWGATARGVPKRTGAFQRGMAVAVVLRCDRWCKIYCF